jgi:deoxyribonuclease V
VPEVEALHTWELSTAEARELQLSLAARVDSTRPLPRVETIAGADVSYELRGKWLYAAVVVLRAATWEVIERVGTIAAASFPYVPGLLSFREAPPVVEAFKRLTIRPDVLICDGQGIAHPRRLGLASHLGLWLDILRVSPSTRAAMAPSNDAPHRLVGLRVYYRRACIA